MKIEFKPQQQDIIDQEGTNLLVSASAGSGKTTVMIAKIVNLILQQKTTVDKVLVLTYTNSAASEMKQKLIKALKQQAADNSALQEEIEKVEMSDISTIHSFCQKLIKRNFYALENLDMSFSLLSDYEKVILMQKAIKQTLADFKQEFSQDYMFLLEHYGKDRSDREIINIVYELNSYLEATLNKTEFRKQIATCLYTNPESAYEILNANLLASVNSFVYEFKQLDSLARQSNVERYMAVTSDVLGALLQITSSNSYLQNINLLISFSFKSLIKQKDFEELGQQIASQKSNLTNWIRTQKQKGFFDQDVNNQGLKQTLRTLNIFLELEKKFEENYIKIKQSKNALDYSDLERYAIKLTSLPSLQKEIKQKYDFIFIDEFQDANPVQEQLLKNIASENNLFMVGDVKQSIYRFRRSSPEIFLKKQQEYEAQISGQNKFLNINFRSDESILEFVNIVFNKIMTPLTAGIDYKNSSKFEAFKKLEQPEHKRVKVVAVQPKQKSAKQNPDKVFSFFDEQINQDDEEIASAEVEAFLVAQDILKLKNSYFFEKGKKRQFNFKDMTIIVRKRSKYFDVFCQKLVEMGIPIYANSSKSIFDEPDSKKILSLLKLAHSFYDDYSLATVLNSFFCNFSLQELADIRLKTNKKDTPFYQSVLEYKNRASDSLAQKLNDFFEFYEQFCLDVQTSGIYSALIKAFNKTGYREKVLCLPQGQQRLVALEKFLQIFLNEQLNFNLSAFLEFALIADKEIKAPNFFAGEQDCVNITTIHSSKGLEYPIVFFVEAGSDLTRGPVSPPLQISDKLGVGLKFYSEQQGKKVDTLALEAIKIENKKEEFAEMLRLLYVGLTRSVEYLYVYGKIDISNGLKQFKNDYEVLWAKSYIELILRSLNQSNLNKINSEKNGVITQGKAEFVFEVINEEEVGFLSNTNKPIVFNQGDISFENQLDSMLKKQYSNKQATTLAVKNSVSSLITQAEYASINLFPQKLNMLEHLQAKNDLAEIGTLYHKVFELLDFNAALTKQDILDIIQNKITSNLKQHLNPDKIFESVGLIKNVLNGQSHVKEKKFMMHVPYSSVSQTDIQQKVLVQGIIDLYSLGNQNILIDYKLTNAASDQVILNRYTKQMQLYKQALMLAFNLKHLNCFILDINRAKLIKVEV